MFFVRASHAKTLKMLTIMSIRWDRYFFFDIIRAVSNGPYQMSHMIWPISNMIYPMSQMKPLLAYFLQFDHFVAGWKHRKCSKRYFSWFFSCFKLVHFSLKPLKMAEIAFLINPFLIRWQLPLKLKLFRPIFSFWSSFLTLIHNVQPMPTNADHSLWS